jgi:hypothetical protein
MVKILDDKFLAVMRALPAGWSVERFERAGMGWIARISNRKLVVELNSDRGYIGAERIVNGKPRAIEVPQSLRRTISPAQVAELIVQQCPQPDAVPAKPMNLATVPLHSLSMPCCRRALPFVDVLAAAEWASNVAQEDVRYWIYFHCPLCRTPAWFGYAQEGGGYFGIYGASPVADLIPCFAVIDLPALEVRATGVTIRADGKRKKIRGPKRFWKRTSP